MKRFNAAMPGIGYGDSGAWHWRPVDLFSGSYYSNNMSDFENYIPLIVQSLQEVDPYRIYLFGSLVSGNITDNSDIDIAVILDSEKTHKTYDDKIKTRVRVRKSIMDISRQVPIDILVWSKPEFQTLKEINPGFVREIEECGKIIYEKHHQRMARGSDTRQNGFVSKQNVRMN